MTMAKCPTSRAAWCAWLIQDREKNEDTRESQAARLGIPARTIRHIERTPKIKTQAGVTALLTMAWGKA